MKKKILVILAAYLPVMYFLFIFSCAPRISFDIMPAAPAPKLRLFIADIRDERPHNESTGYRVVYINSISDGDYPGGFLAAFRTGASRGLGRAFTVVDDRPRADITMSIVVRHFYGEYFRTVKAGVWEFATAFLLFTPRLVTDAVPYNAFAGRAAMEVTFRGRDGKAAARSFDVKIADTVSTYRRGSYDTAARLSRAASVELNRIIREVRPRL